MLKARENTAVKGYEVMQTRKGGFYTKSSLLKNKNDNYTSDSFVTEMTKQILICLILSFHLDTTQ